MAGDIISKKTRQTFREHLVAWTLREIAEFFDAAGVRCELDYQPPVSGQRRTLIEQYYKTVDFSNGKQARNVLDAYEHLLTELEDNIARNGELPGGDVPKAELAKLIQHLERDGFRYKKRRIAHTGRATGLPMVSAAAAALDVPELHRQLERLHEAHEADPALAIGTAKELVETTCKTILHARGIAYNDNAQVTELVKAVRAELGLLPDQIPAAAKGADVMRRLLSNLASVAQGLAELRNLYGTGHGKAGSAKGLAPRHARLAVGSAATLATFLLETHEERQAAPAKSTVSP